MQSHERSGDDLLYILIRALTLVLENVPAVSRSHSRRPSPSTRARTRHCTELSTIEWLASNLVSMALYIQLREDHNEGGRAYILITSHITFLMSLGSLFRTNIITTLHTVADRSRPPRRRPRREIERELRGRLM